MALKDLITDLSNFRYTDYGNAGSIESQVSGRHGTPDAPIDNSDFDNGVGFGQDPNSTPQSFSVRGYQITGNKRFIVNYGGDIQDNDGSIYGLGEFNNIAGIGGIGTAYYSNLNPITPRGSIYRDDSGNYRVPQEFGNTNPPGTDSLIVGFNQTQRTHNIPQIVLTGPFSDTYQSSLNTEPISPNAHGSDFFTSPLTNYTSQFSLDNLNTNINSGFNRASMYIENIDEPNTPIFNQFTRGDSGLKRITLTSPNFNPFVFGDGLPYVIPQHTSTGPTQFTISGFSDEQLIPNLHGSDFMTQPSYVSQISTTTATHNVSMINLTGPTTQDYQTTINIDSVADGAHGSDFLTTPITAFSSRFANQNEFLMNSVFDSGFSTDDFYVDSSNRGPTSFGDFKVFKKSDTSLKTISFGNNMKVFQNDGGNGFTFEDTDPLEFDFKDRLPYNIPARDNTIFGFDQPFMLKDIGDKWGPNVDSTLDEGLVRGGIITSVARGIADGLRLTKFLLTPKGILFAAKQAGFQLLNSRAETRLWNPLSLGSGNTTAFGVPLRIDRHLGGETYEEAIGPAGTKSILTDYGDAVVSKVPALGLGTTTAKRVTLAHLAAMVPGAGGKVSIGALPEIKFNLLRGNIDSLVSGYPISTNPIAFQGNTFSRDSRYDEGWTFDGGISGGTLSLSGKNINRVRTFGRTPILSRVIKQEESIDSLMGGWDPPIMSPYEEIEYGETVRSPIARQRVFYNNGDTSIPAGHYAIYDTYADGEIGNRGGISRGPKVIRPGIMNGNIYTIGDQYYKHNVKYPLNNFKDLTIGKSDGTVSEVLFEQTEPMIFKNTFIGSDKRIYADTLNGEMPLGGNRPIRGHTNLSRIYVSGRFQGDRYDRSKPYAPTEIPSVIQDKPSVDSTSEERLKKGTIQLGDFAIYNKRYFHNNIQGEGPVVPIGSRDTLNTNGYSITGDKTLLKLQLTKEWSEDTYSKDEPYADKPSIFIGDKSMLVMGSGDINTLQLASPLSGILENKISIEKKSAFTHAFANDRVTSGKDSVLPFNDDKFYGNYTSLDGGKYETNPERFQDGQQDSSLIKQLGVKGSVGVDRTTLFGGDTNNTGGKPQEQQIFTTSDADTNQYSKKKLYLGRIEVDGKSNFKSIFFNSDRLKGDPKVDFKTQYVDSDKFSRGGTAPTQGPFVKDGAKLQDFPRLNEQDSGGNYGNEGQALGFLKGGSRKDTHDSLIYGTDDGRQGFGTSKYGDIIKSTDDSSTKYEEKIVDGAPKDTKNLNYLHNVDGVEEGDIGQTPVEATFPSNQKLPTGDINRYRTLAYGDLPTKAGDNKDNKYSERVKRTDKNRPVEPELPLQVAPEFIDKIGLIKVSSNRGGDLLDRIDRINLHEYGEDYNEDYIKFKFYDTINKKFIIFPAILAGISDSVTPEWNTERYIGRPDNVHVYTGTVRELSFNFKIGVFSKQQLLVCWEKINYLIGMTYPTWKKVGNSSRMEAPFMELTIGDMFNRTPGYINSLSYNVEDNTPWDIDEGTQLPKSIDVNVTFIHIGRHKLASQGKHFDLPWLKPLEFGTNPDVKDSSYVLGARPKGFSSVFNNNSTQTAGGAPADG